MVVLGVATGTWETLDALKYPTMHRWYLHSHPQPCPHATKNDLTQNVNRAKAEKLCAGRDCPKLDYKRTWVGIPDLWLLGSVTLSKLLISLISSKVKSDQTVWVWEEYKRICVKYLARNKFNHYISPFFSLTKYSKRLCLKVSSERKEFWSTHIFHWCGNNSRYIYIYACQVEFGELNWSCLFGLTDCRKDFSPHLKFSVVVPMASLIVGEISRKTLGLAIRQTWMKIVCLYFLTLWSWAQGILSKNQISSLVKWASWLLYFRFFVEQ